MARRNIIDRLFGLGRVQSPPQFPWVAQELDQQQQYYHQPPQIYQVDREGPNGIPGPYGIEMRNFSTTSMQSSEIIDLDVEPLKRFITRILPYVIDVSFVRISKTRYSDGRVINGDIEIKLIVSPTYMAELYNEDIKDKVVTHIRNKIGPLLCTMYEHNTNHGISIKFGSERSETILEHLIEE